jgi:hypothetical protein
MFAPYPLTDDGWYVIPGQLKNGREVDLFTGRAPVTYDKPAYVGGMFKNTRWRKYYANLWLADYSGYRLYYGQWLTRQWNAAHAGGDQLLTFQIVYVMERTLGPDRVAPPERLTIWYHQCWDGPTPPPEATTRPTTVPVLPAAR